MRLKYVILISLAGILGYILGGVFHSSNLQIEPHYGRFHTSKPSYSVVILILSNPKNLQQRTAIRNTWARFIRNYPIVKYYFVVGKSDNPTAIDYERSTHQDIASLSINESFDNLTPKLLAAFQMVVGHLNFEYVLKVDDDSFVNIGDFVNALTSIGRDNLYWGYFNSGARVFNRGKWKETNWFLCDTYLPYALGGGYVLSYKLVKFISDNADMLSRYRNEDVSVGAWLAPLNVSRIHDLRFDTQWVSRGCQNYYLVTHKRTPSQMETLFNSLKSSHTLCEQEYQTMKTYSYNWHNVPTKCCSPDEPNRPISRLIWEQYPSPN